MSEVLLFSGVNRARDLTSLKRAFDFVAAEAEAVLRNGAPKKPIHQIILVHAERGLGKTRLVMELYRHLSTSSDLEHYWPNNFERLQDRVAVMPRAETCNYEPILPFLWWGMQVPDNPNPGNTLLSSIEDLLPHLVTMRVAHRRSQNNRTTLEEIGDLGIDVGIELAEVGVEIAGESLGLGAVKRIGEAAFRIGNVVRNRTKDTENAKSEGTKYAATVADEVLKDLDRLLNPKSKHFAHRPAVIFIDDAQYADRDRPLIAFIEKLIEQSARNSWPVLLIFTHWSMELNDSHDGNNNPKPKSLLAEVLDHARNATPSELGNFSGVAGGALTSSNYIEFDLSEKVDDLSPAIVQWFPALNASTVLLITEKSGGNPRKLEQIFAVLARKPKWFQDFSFENDLTSEGLNALSILSDLPIEQIVYDRLVDTPLETRCTLALASTVGSSFVVDLVERLATARSVRNVRSNLETSEAVYRFLKNVRERSRDDIGYFSEPLFFDAACEYRANAKADFADWPSDAEIFAVLDDILAELVDKPANFFYLNELDLAHSLNIAADRMIAKNHEKAGLALAQLVRVENRRGNFEGAYIAAQRFIEGFEQ